jgi:23S rRNA (adenine2503-C2)-methyltransferase
VSATSATPPPSRYGATRADVERLLAGWGEPKYRTNQLWAGLTESRLPLDDITSLPRALRERLTDALPLALTPAVEATAQDGLTTKWLWRATRDGTEIETVLMRSPHRATVCVSSQAGCAMACTFCATGQAGLDRHLDAGEIVEQVVRAQHGSPQRLSNVVFMGMGEPLANFEPVWESVERMHKDLGISARQITVSTVGVVPGMRRLAQESLPVTLAVSLHAADDELRSTLVPLNRRYPIADVLDAAAEVAGAHGRRVSFEYAVIHGVNDKLDHAGALGRLLAAWPGVGGAHVNLIPLNPTSGFSGRAPAPARVRAFAEAVRRPGVTVTIRRNRGVDIDAACGQLRARERAGSEAESVLASEPVAAPARMSP